MLTFRTVIAALTFTTLSAGALAQEVTVMISGGFKAALEKLTPQDGGGLPRGAGGFARRDGRQSGRAGAGYQYGTRPAANAAEGAFHGLFRQRQRPVC